MTQIAFQSIQASVFIPISKMEKRYTNFGQNGGGIWKIIEIGIGPSGWPSVRPCAKDMYTKTQERIEIIEWGFFLCERCILEIETAKISTHERLRSKGWMKFITTLLYLKNRLMKSVHRFFILKVWTRKKLQDPIGLHPKMPEVGAEWKFF